MQLGLIGLGKMGGNMRERVRRAGHEVIGYDTDPEVSDAESVQAMVDGLQAPRTVWVMVPAGKVTREVITDLADRLSPGDLVIDADGTNNTRHVVIFEKWNDAAKTSYTAYEQTGDGDRTRHRTLRYGLESNSQYHAYRPNKFKD